MKVLLLSDCLDNGGLERQMALLATTLPREHPRRVWTMREGPFLPYLLERGVPVTVRRRRYRFDPSPAAALWHDLMAWRPDVVHSWSWIAALVVAPACRALGIPLIDGMIQTGALEPDYRFLKRLTMRLSTLVVANSRSGLDAWGIGPAKGRVVHNGFDASRLSARTPVPRSDPRFTVIMTGRMVPVKHYDVVIEAARQLCRASNDWRFVLLGDGPDRARLMAEAQDLVAADAVVFPTPDLEVLDRVQEADVGVLMTDPSLAREGLSNSIMEYMAAGLPVVCGDGGGNPELVIDGITGFIVPQADPGRLAERLEFLHEHREAAAVMGVAGRTRIRDVFSVETMVCAMVRVYREAAARMTRA